MKNQKGFSLIELLIVVVIIGIIAAIAIPRMSRGSAGAANSALSGNLAVLRSAIDLYLYANTIAAVLTDGATGMATMAMAIALLGALWPLMHLAIALF